MVERATKNHSRNYPEREGEKLGEASPKTPGKTPGKTPDMILSALREDAVLSIPEIAVRIGKSESAVECAIRKLRGTGKLERIGPAKGGYWQVIGEDSDEA